MSSGVSILLPLKDFFFLNKNKVILVAYAFTEKMLEQNLYVGMQAIFLGRRRNY